MKRTALTAVVCALAMVAGAQQAVYAKPRDPDKPKYQEYRDRVSNPDKTLSRGWQSSSDRMVTLAGDDTGLHVLVAEEKQAYRWRTVATLREQNLPTDMWIGQHCVTGSGRRAVVVYAPRQFTNREELMERGAFAAIVDLDNGEVTKLPGRVSLAYHNPGCGLDEQVALSRLERTGETAQTWVGLVNAQQKRTSYEVRVKGQVTSAVPFEGRLAAAKNGSLISVGRDGKEEQLAATGATPFRLYPDREKGLAYQLVDGDTVHIERFAGGAAKRVGSAPVGQVKLSRGPGGKVFAVGGKASQSLPKGLPGGWQAIDAPPDSEVSSNGALRLTSVGRERITAKTASGADLRFSFSPESTEVVGGGASTTPSDPDRACSVARNDPKIQAYQPNAAQVEWAADLAVRGQLTFQRPGNWANNGLPAYSPQGLFPSVPLTGGGYVPAQILLGILAQESNLWQASYHVVDGSAGNPLTSLGFYGLDLAGPNYGQIDWSKVDCGYGVAQVTTGMRRSDTNTVVGGVTMDDLHQKAVALDYATNIAAGLRILQDKWNVTRNAGLIANDGDPRYLENWWFAIWAYNTGFYANQHDGGPWGVGWANNPANPTYPADRQMFLTSPLPQYGDEIGYDNAKHPNHWSYPERVIGFAYQSLIKIDYTTGDYGLTFRRAKVGPNLPEVDDAQPGHYTFCRIDVNECDQSILHQPGDYPGEKPGPCSRDDLMCWWHGAASWMSCLDNCAQEDRAYTTVEPRPYAESIHPEQCNVVGLPSGVRIIDDLDFADRNSDAPLGPNGCQRTGTKGGTFELEFAGTTYNGQTVYPSKVDFHQVGAGFGGHFWFAHTYKGLEPNGVEMANPPAAVAYSKVTGRWNINPTNAWTRIYVHLPDNGAHTQQAAYRVHPTTASVKERIIPTRYERNTWVDIGVFDFTGPGTPYVELDNFTRDGGHDQDIAWDAIAVEPLPAKPKHFVVGMGDSYSSGEGTGVENLYYVSHQYEDEPNGEGSARDSCHRSVKAWPRLTVLPGYTYPIGDNADGHHPSLDFHFVACSGARTYNMVPQGEKSYPAATEVGRPQYGEVPQIDSGFLDENTTLVVLTIGGNDARFSDLLDDCAHLNCPPAEPVYADLRDKVFPAVQGTLTWIHVRAPNARIMLMGYPNLFSDNGECTGYPPEDPLRLASGWANALSDRIWSDVTLAQSSSTLHVIAADTRLQFMGHGLCGIEGHQNSHINGLVGAPNNWHPTIAGQVDYATVLRQALIAIGYQGNQ